MNGFCSTCSNAIGLDGKFCPKCGAAISVATPLPASPVAASTTLGSGSAERSNGQALPTPPSLHWGIVLALSVVTLGVFAWIWAFVQAISVKRLTGTWKPLLWFTATCTLLIAALIRDPDAKISSLWLLFALGVFSMRRQLVRYYNNVEPIDLDLGRVETFFGSIFYIQYHLTRIARMKREKPHLFAPNVTPVVAP